MPRGHDLPAHLSTCWAVPVWCFAGAQGVLAELITEAGGRVAARFVPLERRSRVCGSLCYICDASMCSGCSQAAHGRMNLPFDGTACWFLCQICHLWASVLLCVPGLMRVCSIWETADFPHTVYVTGSREHLSNLRAHFIPDE